jgi:hypothetical protein
MMDELNNKLWNNGLLMGIILLISIADLGGMLVDMALNDNDQTVEVGPVHKLHESTMVIVSPGHPTNEEEFNLMIGVTP